MASALSFFPGLQGALEAEPLVAGRRLRLKQRDALPDDFARLVAEDFFDGGIGEVNLALRVHEDDGVGAGFPEEPIAEFALAEGFAGLGPLGAVGGLADLALDHGAESAEVALHQIIVRAGLHRLHRRRLADAAGDDDERNVEAALLHYLQGLGRAEVGEVVVGEHHVPPWAGQGGEECGPGFHTFAGDLEAGLADQARHHLGVKLRILDDQNAERGLHG